MPHVKELNDEQKLFCALFGLTPAQFFGIDVIEKDLLLTKVDIPEGFSPSIIHGCLDLEGHRKIPSSLRPKVITCYLDISHLDEIPEDFAPLVGTLFHGDVGYGNVKCVDSTYHRLKSGTLSMEKTTADGALQIVEGYVAVDGFVDKLIEKKGRLYTLFDVVRKRTYYLYSDGKVSAHGDTPEKAKADYRFKKIALKYEHQKIKADDIITPELYRAITGACELGISEWMLRNIPTKDLARVRAKGVTARQLRDMLRLKGGYGSERFEQLCEF